eukprot:SAG31_NODE_5204_length_2678_cov_1.637069_1_plen_86_part_00
MQMRDHKRLEYKKWYVWVPRLVWRQMLGILTIYSQRTTAVRVRSGSDAFVPGDPSGASADHRRLGSGQRCFSCQSHELSTSSSSS